MKKRFLGALMVLCFVVVGLVATSPAQPATATPPAPMNITGARMGMISMIDDDRLLTAPCDSNFNLYPSATIASSDGIVSLPTGSPWTCWGSEPATLSVAGHGNTIYAPRVINGIPHLTAYKNDRVLWSTELLSEVDCLPNQYQDYGMILRSVSVGADGNIYGILYGYLHTSAGGPCGNHLAGYDADTGVEIFRQPLSTSETAMPWSRVWTYPDGLLVMDIEGTVREFSYAGTENVSKRYQFPLISVRDVQANSAKRVVAVGINTMTSVEEIRIHDSNGHNDSIAMPSAYGYIGNFGLTGSGDVFASHWNGTVYDFDLVGETVVPRTFTVPDGYMGPSMQGIYRADDGTFVAVRSIRTSSWEFTITVDKIDGVTGLQSNLFWLDNETDGVTDLAGVYGGDLYLNGYLYLPICYSDCSTEPGLEQLWLHKLDLTGLSGIENPQSNTRHAPYESQKLKYVALGDSFSSGEGVEPFLPGTDIDTVNECHRSEDAYPLLLEEDESLNLDLTAFVACSGATTSNITSSGQWGEPAQVEALSEHTDVVTLTIGGNDIGFGDIIEGCANINLVPSGMTHDEYCESLRQDAWDVINDPDFLTSIQLVLLAIETSTRVDTEIYVVGYPVIIPTTAVPCTWGPASLYWIGMLSSQRAITAEEREDLHDLTLALNEVLDNATVGFNAEYVDPVDAFWGHAVCQSEPHFNEINWPDNKEYSLHPNQVGQSAYYNLLKEVID